ncbi:MAG: disulfide bond formation protein B [Gammaproteobacteria bacterium]|nr:disulfide bond formation protein B [Gammaproteobacteria bacterium]
MPLIDPLSRRAWNLLGFAACALLIAYALYTQHAGGLEPCPLCILQRFAVIGLGLVFLIAALHDPKRNAARFYAILLGVIALVGAGISGWHVRLQHLPASDVPSCGPGLDYMLEVFPLLETLKLVFTASGECANVDWAFLGLGMPAWVLICVTLLGLLGVSVNWRKWGHS